MPNDTMTPARNAVRTFNKYLLNPVMMLLAGRKHWYAAVIRHTGRRSGKHYATPVVADRVADGFILPLPYGTGVDWLRNLIAAGQTTITVSGQTYEVAEPEIIDCGIGRASAVAQTSAGFSPVRNRQFRQTETGEVISG